MHHKLLCRRLCDIMQMAWANLFQAVSFHLDLCARQALSQSLALLQTVTLHA